VGSLRNFDDFGAVFPHFCPDKREIWNVNYCQKIIIITYLYPAIDRNFRGSGGNSNSNSRICSAPPTISPKVHCIVSTRCEKEKTSDVAVDDRMSFSSVGTVGDSTHEVRQACR